MNHTSLFPVLCILFLVSLAAAPVLAATTVTCPSSCSCLLPAEAKKLGSPGYCNGKQAVCGYDSQKNEKYCYEKLVKTTAPQLSVTGFKVVTTTPTTVTPQKYAAGCTCLSSTDGKGKGLLYCNGKQTVCGYSITTPLYCFALSTPATTPTTITPAGGGTTPVLMPCPATCECTLDEKAAGAATPLTLCGDVKSFCGSTGSGTPMYCYAVPYATRVSPVAGDQPPIDVSTRPPSDQAPPEITQRPSDEAPVPVSQRPADGPLQDITRVTTTSSQGGSFFSGIGSFFASLFSSSSPPQSSSLQPVPCNGVMTYVMTDPDNCGSCGHPCPGTSVCEQSVCVDKTCEEALFLERKENADLRARLDLLSERYAELETRFNYCLWLEDYYKGGYNHCCGDHCLYPPEPTDDVPMVTDSGE